MSRLKSTLIAVSLCLTISGLSQNVNTIIEKNIFDPKRGEKKDTVAENNENAEENVELPKELPTLDGICIIKDYKRIILSYKDEESKRYVSGYFKEGSTIADTIVKQILDKHVILVHEGVSYKVTVDSKYNTDMTTKHTAPVRSKSSSSNQPKVVSRDTNSNKNQKITSSRSTPFGGRTKKPTTKKTGNSKKKLPF